LFYDPVKVGGNMNLDALSLVIGFAVGLIFGPIVWQLIGKIKDSIG
jgi:hypothetical protein